MPTVAESGVPGLDIDPWVGIAAPPRVPPEVAARIGQAIREITELPDVQMRMAKLGLNLDFRNSDQFREFVASEHQKYGAVIREAGIKPD